MIRCQPEVSSLLAHRLPGGTRRRLKAPHDDCEFYLMDPKIAHWRGRLSLPKFKIDDLDTHSRHSEVHKVGLGNFDLSDSHSLGRRTALDIVILWVEVEANPYQTIYEISNTVNQLDRPYKNICSRTVK
ncbi:hypothetical protein TNCV_1902861 [Trichonephila clavipes]|nr:hypothetical protein TNCV_1902861 [Trichonephila clavipes]